jgi:DNA-directed RNA polymerase specialized sigma24 family protein
MQQRQAWLRAEAPEERVAAIMAAHGRVLLRVAGQWSLCHDDALDAYQRALEIFLRRADTIDAVTEVAWLKVVVKHEALAIRRARAESVTVGEVDFDAVAPVAQRPVEDVVVGGERVSRSAEALRTLKPDEARALLLKAEGLSYTEIAEHCGWSYTKVNRAITEGRRRFMRAYAAIDSGEECERFAPVLAALAAGTASSADLVEVRPHLRHCTACRATVRELHSARPRRVRIFVPLFALASAVLRRPSGVDHARPAEHLLHGGGASSADAAGAAASSGDVIGTAAHAAGAIDPGGPVLGPGVHIPHAIDVGGQLLIPIDQAARTTERVRRLGFGRVRDDALAVLNRADVTTGIQLAVSGGGGRIATIATLIGFCVSGVGAGALCVATGIVSVPGWIADHPHAAPTPPRARAARHASPRQVGTPAPLIVVSPAPTRVPTPAPVRQRARRRAASSDPSQGSGPKAHESAPISPAAPASTSEFSPERSAGTTTSPPPAPASSTGGGEFTP